MSVERVHPEAPGDICVPCAADCRSEDEAPGLGELPALIVSGLSLAASFALNYFAVALPTVYGWPLDPAWLAVLLGGIPIVREAVRGLVESFDVKAGLLIALALIAAVAIQEIFAAGEVAFLMRLGEILEARTVRRSRAGLDRLLSLSPKMARVVEGDEERMVPVPEVRVDQLIRVRPGEMVPVDGLVVRGRTAVDQSAITGESVPVDLGPGDEVPSGALNRFGAFEIRASRVGADSSLARLIRLVEEADSRKAKIARLADRWATVIVPAALALAVAVGLATGDVIRAVSILIVFCPCGLVLATPTAVAAAIGAATRRGVLVRSGEALERLGAVTHMAFDKTGTLTRGELRLAGLAPFEGAGDDFLALAAAAEAQSEHPLGQAVVRAAREQNLAFSASDHFTMEPGLGIVAGVGGRTIRAGRPAFLEKFGLTPTPAMRGEEEKMLAAGQTVIWLAEDGRIRGLLGLADTIRPESRETVAALKEVGLQVILLTGDNEKAAASVAGGLGIDEVRSGLLPGDKVAAIRALQSQGRLVAMAGDGLNDAPALKTASVGLALGGIGSEVTLEAAEVVLLGGSLQPVPFLLKLSRRTLSTIKVNIAMALGINAAAVILASMGIMGPVLSALVHNLGAVLVVINATRLYHFQAGGLKA